MDKLKTLQLQVLRKILTTWAITHSVILLILIFLGTSVGEGTFGKVKLGKHILTGEKVKLEYLKCWFWNRLLLKYLRRIESLTWLM